MSFSVETIRNLVCYYFCLQHPVIYIPSYRLLFGQRAQTADDSNYLLHFQVLSTFAAASEMNWARDDSSCLGTVLQDRLSFCHWQRAQKGKVNKRLNFLQLQRMMDWSASPSELFISRRQNYHFVLNQKSQIHFPKTALLQSLLGSRIQIKDRTLKSRIRDLVGFGDVDLGKPTASAIRLTRRSNQTIW